MKRMVWLNIENGEFSNSWEVDENGDCVEFHAPLTSLIEPWNKQPEIQSKWKLIEYVCHTDSDFQFYNQMKLR